MSDDGIKISSSEIPIITDPSGNEQLPLNNGFTKGKILLSKIKDYISNALQSVFVPINGDKTINDTKTFTSPVNVPNGIDNSHTVNKSQLDDKYDINTEAVVNNIVTYGYGTLSDSGKKVADLMDKVSGATEGSNAIFGTDGQVISGGGGTDDKVRVTSADTTNSYLYDKIVGGTGITTSIINTGANEQLQIDGVWTKSGDDISYSGGNVSIGDSVNNTDSLIVNGDVGISVPYGTSNADLNFRHGYDNVSAKINSFDYVNSYSIGLSFKTTNSTQEGLIERLNILPDGNVAIGYTGTNTHKLRVAGTTYFDGNSETTGSSKSTIGHYSPYSALTPGATVSYDLTTGFKKTLSVAVDTTITFSNVENGMGGVIVLDVTVADSDITFAGTGLTFKGKGTFTDLAIGTHDIAYECISDTEIHVNIGSTYDTL